MSDIQCITNIVSKMFKYITIITLEYKDHFICICHGGECWVQN